MGGSARTFVMIGVAVVAAVAAPYLAPFIEAGLGAVGVDAIGTTVSLIQAGAAPEVAAGIASAVAPTVAGAVTGTVAGGAQAELAGGDLWEGAFQGALTGAVGGAVSSGVSSVLPADLDPALKSAATGAILCISLLTFPLFQQCQTCNHLSIHNCAAYLARHHLNAQYS